MTFAPDGHAQIWQDDTLVQVEPTPISYGDEVLYMQIIHPPTISGMTSSLDETRVVPIQRGNTYVVVNDMGGFDSTSLVARRRAVVDGYRREGLTADSRQMTCEALNLIGLGWSSQFEQAIGLLGKTSGAVPIFDHSLAVFRQNQYGGFGTDILSSFMEISRDGDIPKSYGARNAAVILGSAMEHGILQQLYPGTDGVSTVRDIQQNNANGWKTYLATAANYPTVLADSGNLYQWPGYGNAFNQILQSSSTAQLIIPEDGFQRSGQLAYSAGYFSLDSSTGSLAAYISLDITTNGGYTTSNGTVDPTKDPTPKNGTQGPNGGNKESKEPIDLYTGAYVYDRADLTLGGNGAKGLSFSRHYSSDLRGGASPLGTGWTHSYNTFLTEYTDTASAFGQTTPVAAAAMISACYALNDCMLNESGNAKGWVTSCIIANWAMDQVRNNAVTLTVDRKNYVFNRLSDGSFAPSAGLTAQLVKESGTGLYRIQERFDRTTYFDASLHASCYIDADGNGLSYLYDPNGALHSVTDAYGSSLTFGYNGNGLLQTVTDPTGRSVSYGYDSSNRLSSATDPEGYTTQFGYDSADRLQTITDESGATLAKNSYDSNDRVIQQVLEGDSQQTWNYAFTSLRNIEIKPSGELTTWLYDEKGRNTGVIDGLGNRSYLFYDGQDQLVQETDPRGFNTFFQYDGANNLRFVTNANNHTAEYRYDGAFHLRKSFDALGKETDFGYDEHHHLNQITDPAGHVTNFTYSAGLLQNITAPGGDFTQFEYDGNGFPNKITRADGSVETPSYNARGDLLSTQITSAGDPNTHSKSFTYDKRRLLLTGSDSLGFGPSNGYDARGFLTLQTDRFGNSTSFEFSPMGHGLTSTAASGAVTTNHYDASGRRDWGANALQQVTQFGYDGASRLVSTTDALMQTGTTGYDASGNRNAFANPRGKSYGWTFTPINLTGTLTTPMNRTFGKTYDGRDLLRTIQQPSGNTTTLTYFDDKHLHQSADSLGTIDYEYDSKGRLYTVTEGAQVIKREYNSLDRLTKFTDGSNNVIQYQYDGAGNLALLTYPDGKTVTYAYDSADRLDHVTDWAHRVTQFGYDNHSRLSTISFPNGRTRTYGYDSAGRRNLIRDSGTNSQIISQFVLDHDPLDRIAKETMTPEPAPFSIAPASMTYDDDDRLATWNGQTCASDLDGNLTTGPLNGSLTTFGFDARNRLSSIGNTTFTYDAENRRVAQTINGVTTSYVNDPQGARSRLLVAATASGTARYVYANGQLLYGDTGTGLQVYHFDSRGSTVAITDETGAVTDRVVYGDYGEIAGRTGTTATPFLFNGAFGVQTDSNGLLYMRARYYSIETRRFLNADPTGFGGGANWYAYVKGDPVNLMDPFGLCPTDYLDIRTYWNATLADLYAFNNAFYWTVGELGYGAEQINNWLVSGPIGLDPMALGPEAELGPALEALSAWGRGLRAAEGTVVATAPVEKFSEYIFKEGATHGKDAVFRSLGYSAEDSAQLASMWEEQAAAKYANGDFTLGKLDQWGQRINISIEVPGIGSAAGTSSSMQSGWMIQSGGGIKLNTPFAGFSK